MPVIEIAPFLAADAELQFNAPKHILDNCGEDQSWTDRPRIQFEVQDDEPLHAVIVRAAHELGIFPKADESGWVEAEPTFRLLFQSATDDSPVNLHVLLDEDGSLTWAFNFFKVSHRQVKNAVDVHVVDVNPSRLYIDLGERHAWGGNGFFYWNEFLRTFPQVLIYLGGVYGGVRAFIDLGWATYKTVLKLQERWHDKRATLPDIRSVIQYPRTDEEQARLLGASATDVSPLLRALGSQQSVNDDNASLNTSDLPVLRLALLMADLAAEAHMPPELLQRCLDEVAALPEEQRMSAAGDIMTRLSAEQRQKNEPQETVDYRTEGDEIIFTLGSIYLGSAEHTEGFMFRDSEGRYREGNGGRVETFQDLEDIRFMLVHEFESGEQT